ncbi:nadh dehydrogenase subunit c, partial [Nannochloropsis gaditana]
NSKIFKDELILTVHPKDLYGVMKFLKYNMLCQFNCLTAISGTDYPERENRFEVSYELLIPSLPPSSLFSLSNPVFFSPSLLSMTQLDPSSFLSFPPSPTTLLLPPSLIGILTGRAIPTNLTVPYGHQ